MQDRASARLRLASCRSARVLSRRDFPSSPLVSAAAGSALLPAAVFPSSPGAWCPHPLGPQCHLLRGLHPPCPVHCPPVTAPHPLTPLGFWLVPASSLEHQCHRLLLIGVSGVLRTTLEWIRPCSSLAEEKQKREACARLSAHLRRIETSRRRSGSRHLLPALQRRVLGQHTCPLPVPARACRPSRP